MMGEPEKNKTNFFQQIVEEKECTEEQKQIKLVNGGVYCFQLDVLCAYLSLIQNVNAQNEYYLTDVVAMAVAQGIGVTSVDAPSPEEVEGVNNKLQLGALERCYQRRLADALMLAGTTLADPARVDIRGELSVGQDVFIDVNTVFSGNVTLGDNVSIGSNCVVSNSSIGDNTELLANCVVDQATLANDCIIGPFARLRPGSTFAEKSKVGNFVEVKNSSFGEGSKANHLAYVGDAQVGAGSNIGAGTITCNYDGANKHKTRLGKNVFIGSNSTLVAPLDIADNGFVAAGSTIVKTVLADSLAVARGRQKNIEGWTRPSKKS